MFELEMSNQSHTILLLRNDLNNKDIEIVELKGLLQDSKIKMERMMKEKDKQIRERSEANIRYSICITKIGQALMHLQLERGLRNENANDKYTAKGVACV